MDSIETISHRWGWILALAIVFIIMGAIALSMPVLTTLAAVTVFGIFLLVGGVIQWVESLACKKWSGFFWHILFGLLYVAAGWITISNPALSSLTLTLALGGILLALGLFRLIFSFKIRPIKGWGWTAFSGVLSILLALIILMHWPVSGLTVIGLFIGIDMLFYGSSQLFLSLALKQINAEGSSSN